MLFSSSMNLFSSLRIIGLHMKNSINSFRHKYQFSDTETTFFFPILHKNCDKNAVPHFLQNS